MANCSDKQSAFKATVDAFAAEVKSNTDAVSAETQKDLEERQDEWKKRSDVEFEFEVTFEATSILIPVVEVTVVDQKWSLDLPQVTMKQQDIIFDVPATKMTPMKTGQYPEIYCEDTWISLPFGGKTKGIPECKVVWKDIITLVPEFYMERKTISLHLPEFKIDRTDMILGVPEFKVSQQEVVIHLPQFKLKSIHINPEGAKKDAEEMKKDADAFAAEAKGKIENGLVKAREGAKLPVILAASEFYNCLRDDLLSKRKAIEGMFIGIVGQAEASLAALTQSGGQATPEAQSIRESISQTKSQMASALAKVDQGLVTLISSEKEQIEKIVGPGMRRVFA